MVEVFNVIIDLAKNAFQTIESYGPHKGDSVFLVVVAFVVYPNIMELCRNKVIAFVNIIFSVHFEFFGSYIGWVGWYGSPTSVVGVKKARGCRGVEDTRAGHQQKKSVLFFLPWG